MQHTQTASTTENAALEAWHAFLSRHQRLAACLNIVSSVSGYFLNGHDIVALVRWLVTVAGRIAESALLLATLYVTLNNVAHTLLTWIIPAPGIELLNYLSVVAFSILPELIVGIAITTTYNHWKLFFRAPAWKNSSWVWGTLYLVPTSVFTVMTITTLASFVQIVAASGNPGQATGMTLTVRFLAGWSYSLVEILFVTIGKKSYAERFDGLRATIATLQQELVALRTREQELRATEQRLQAQVQKALTEGHGYQQSYQSVATELQSAKGYIATLQLEKGQIIAERDDYQEEITHLQEELRTLKARLARRSVAIAPTANVTPEAPQSTEDTGYMARDNGVTMAVANSQGETIIATGSHRERIKETMVRAMQNGEELSYGAIAQAAGAGYSTVKKYAKELQAEIAREITDGHVAITVAQES
jgi:hypothetical protein